MNNFITPMVWNPAIKGWQVFILAGLYKMAYLAAKDSKLAI